MSEQNVEVVRHIWERFAAFDADESSYRELVDEVFDAGLVAEDFTMTPVAGMPGVSSVGSGRAGLIELLEGFADAWDSWSVRPEEYIGADDRVVVLVTLSGTGKSSGAEVSVPFAAVHTLVDGQVVRREDYLDKAAALRAAGLAD